MKRTRAKKKPKPDGDQLRKAIESLINQSKQRQMTSKLLSTTASSDYWRGHWWGLMLGESVTQMELSCLLRSIQANE